MSQNIRIRIKHLGKVKIVLNKVESIPVGRMNAVCFYYTNLKMVSVGVMLHQCTQLLPRLLCWVVLGHTFNANITHLNKKIQTQEFQYIICFQDANTQGKRQKMREVFMRMSCSSTSAGAQTACEQRRVELQF